MNIALIGYGKMGKLIEQIALKRGHNIVSIIDKNNLQDFTSPSFKTADVAFEFTTPQTAMENIRQSWKYSVGVVCGTTGWDDELEKLKEEIKTNGKRLFWASNFSLGVNIFFEINKKMAEIVNQFPQYDITIEETHHTQKQDAPSGTAISLYNEISSVIKKFKGWTLSPQKAEDKMEITAIRQGNVFGVHTTRYESQQDIISLRHEAKSREGFALGAVIAAEFMQYKNGFFTMTDLLKF